MAAILLLGPLDNNSTAATEPTATPPPAGITFESFVWTSKPPQDIPFAPSTELVGIRFLGRCSDYRVADTWYPTWASDGNLYSPFTDGPVGDDLSISDADWQNQGKDNARTGQAVLIGDDPLQLTIKSLGMVKGNTGAYNGRYPCGSLIHHGVWYYGTYCLGPRSQITHEGFTYNWPVLGPMPGFRISKDYGRTWTGDTTQSRQATVPRARTVLGPGQDRLSPFRGFRSRTSHIRRMAKRTWSGTVRIRSSIRTRYANNSWISGDQIYLLRVTPSEQTINDLASYEFFAGRDAAGQPVWTRDFAKMEPLLEWQNNMGCVTVTYNAPLKKVPDVCHRRVAHGRQDALVHSGSGCTDGPLATRDVHARLWRAGLLSEFPRRNSSVPKAHACGSATRATSPPTGTV